MRGVIDKGGRDLKLSEMKKPQLLAKVLRDFNDSESYHSDHQDKWEQFYKMYRSKHEDTEIQKNRSNLFIPYVFAIIETITPRAVKAVISNKPFLAVFPNDEYGAEKAKAIESLIQFQLETKINFVRLATDWLKDMLIYGTGIVRTSWKKKTAMRKRRQMLPYFDEETGQIEMVPQEIEEEVVVYDAPWIDNVDLFDFFIEPHAKDIDSAGYAIQRLKMSEEELQERVDQGYYNEEVTKYLKKIKDGDGVIGGAQTSADTYGTMKKAEAMGFGSGTELPKFEVLEYWTNDHVVAVLDREVIIKNEPNPYYHNQKPFISAVDIPVTNEFYGIGEVENLQDLQLELNTLRNQRLDNVSITLNAMWKVLRHADVDVDQLKSRTGGIVFVDDMQDIDKLEFPNITGNAYEEVATIQKDMDNTSGVYDYARGRTTDRRETATTANILTSSANERFDMKIIMLAEEGLKRLGKHLISLNQQYLESDVTVRTAGEDPMSPEFQEISLSDVLGTLEEYDIIVTGTAVNTNLSKEARLDKMINLYSLLKDEPLINKPAYFREVLNLAGARDAKSFLMPGAEQLAMQLTLQNLLGQQEPQQQQQPQQPPQMGGFNDGGVL